MADRIDLYEYAGVPKEEGRVGYLEPVPVEGSRKAALIIPGGGYERTSDRESLPIARRFAERGVSSFVLRYSCAPSAFPTPLREAALAMRYIREKYAPDAVAAIGFSAGGHLAGLLGTIWDAPETADIAPANVVRPDGLGLCYPVTVAHGPTHEVSMDNISGHDKALRDRLSLDKLARSDMMPTYLWHTRNDGSVPVIGTLLLAEAIERAGVEFALHVYRSGAHGLATADIETNSPETLSTMSGDVPCWVDEAARFFNETCFAGI